MFIKGSKLWFVLMMVVVILLFNSSTQESNSEVFKILLPSQQVPLVELSSSLSSSSNNLFSSAAREAQQQCFCPNCGCNAQTPCPKSVPASNYVVLAAMEDCGAQRKVPAIGLVNIQSTSESNGFTYCIVDEDNKNKAMRGEAFNYASYKNSAVNAMTCVSNNNPAFRFPSQIPGKAYLIAKSSNLLMNTDVRFNVQMSCAIPPSDHVEIKVEPSSARFYVGTRATYSVSFVNQYNNLDTWQQGIMSLQNDNTVMVPVTDGKSSLIYTPTSTGPLTLALKYAPSPSELGNPITFSAQTIMVYKIATAGSIEVSERVSKKEFTVTYTIKDNDGTVTPKIDLSKLSFKSSEPSLDLKCVNPSTESGSGSVTCSSSVSGTIVLLMQYNGNRIAASRTFSIEDINEDSGNVDPKVNPQTIIIGVVVLVAIVVVVFVVAIVIGIVLYLRYLRRRKADLLKERVKLPPNEEAMEEPMDDELMH